MKKVTNIWKKLLDKIEPDVTLELDEIKFSKKYGHEVCVMHLVGKNVFPIMTASEILSNPKARAGLSKDDLILITRLDMEIKLRSQQSKVVEYDKNGIVTIANEYGSTKKYADKEISTNLNLIKSLNSKDAHRIGYNVGFKTGRQMMKQQAKLVSRLKKFLGF